MTYAAQYLRILLWAFQTINTIPKKIPHTGNDQTRGYGLETDAHRKLLQSTVQVCFRDIARACDMA